MQIKGSKLILYETLLYITSIIQVVFFYTVASGNEAWTAGYVLLPIAFFTIFIPHLINVFIGIKYLWRFLKDKNNKFLLYFIICVPSLLFVGYPLIIISMV